MSKVFDLSGRVDETSIATEPDRSAGGPHVRFAAPPPRTAPTVGNDRRPATQTIIQTRDLKKSYQKGKHAIAVLQGVNLNVAAGEFVAIIGQSGSGKSTLLHLMGTLDVPDSGQIHFQNQRIDNLAAKRRDRLRNQSLGMIFQFYHLLPELTTLENVLVPSMINQGVFSYWRQSKSSREHAESLLELVGLSHRLTHRPRELSGGEMQRAAIARALISRPDVLLADEPTGNLDQKTGQGVLDVLRRLNREHGLTIVMVTHDVSIARQTDRTVRLVEGRVT